MLKLLLIRFEPLVWALLACYLGYGISIGLLPSFIPDSCEMPAFFTATAGFFWLLRWLRIENAAHRLAGGANYQCFSAGRRCHDRRRFGHDMQRSGAAGGVATRRFTARNRRLFTR